MPDDERSGWWRQQANVPNLLLVGTVLIGVGGYVTSVRTLEIRVAALEQARLPAAIAAAEQAEALRSIKDQLSEIKSDVKDIKQRR